MERKLIRPDTMDEALSEREQYGMDALPIAGGQSLLVMLRNKLIDPKILIDLQTLDELHGMQAAEPRRLDRRDDDDSSICCLRPTCKGGADVWRRRLPKSARRRSGIWARSAATSVTTSPARICRRRCWLSMRRWSCAAEKATRKVPLTEFFRSYFETVVAPEELLCGVEIPKLPERRLGRLLEARDQLGRSRDCRRGGGARSGREAGRGVREVRIGLGGVAPVPFRAAKAERLLNGAVLSDEAIREAARDRRFRGGADDRSPCFGGLPAKNGQSTCSPGDRGGDGASGKERKWQSLSFRSMAKRWRSRRRRRLCCWMSSEKGSGTNGHQTRLRNQPLRRLYGSVGWHGRA